MENKQTAVAWLAEQFEESYSYINEIFKETIEQAKEMEKEQIIDAVNFGQTNYTDTTIEDKEIAKQYYKETYGKQTDSN
jgi:hypothetical protein